MKVGIHLGGVQGGHEVRGIGVHTSELIKAIEKLEDKDWDLSTALHFLDACYTRKELAEIAKTLN